MEQDSRTREISAFFRVLYRFHRFYWISIKLGFLLGSGRQFFFYRLRSIMIAIDAVLSLGYYLSILGTLGTVVAVFFLPAMIPLTVFLCLDLSFWLLLRLEKRERKAHQMKPFLIYNINVGSAKTMSGQVKIGHIFLQPGRVVWTKHRRQQVIEKAKRATSWIQEQARDHAIDVAFEDVDLGTAIWPSASLPQYENGYSELDQLSQQVHRVVSEAGFTVEPSDNFAVLVHAAERLRSYAVPAHLGVEASGGPSTKEQGGEDQRRNVEFAVVAHHERPSVYAHELLHLFGADDYYHASCSMLHVAKDVLLYRCIMFNGGILPLNELSVSGTTAQNIGWC